MSSFWRNSGFHLLKRGADGYLGVTDDFLRAYLQRPELAPVEESCDNERRLHAELMMTPRMPVSTAALVALADADARNNYQALLRFREHLLEAESAERCYLNFFRGQALDVPPLFLQHLTHVIAHNMLASVDDPYLVRAAELLFRDQVVTILDGAILLADDETVEMRQQRPEPSQVSLIELAEGGAASAPATVELDVLGEKNAGQFWARSDRFDMVLDISFARPGLEALCRVLERWVMHFLAVEVRIQPTQKISDEGWVWHSGLDAESSEILNDLYQGNEISEERNERLLSLFRLEFRHASEMRPDLAGRPVYLGLAMTAERRLRMKPQNLLVNLPLATPA